MENHKPLILVKLIGNFEIEIAGNQVDLELLGSMRVLAYLALATDNSETRERLASIMWPDMDDDRARANLRQALFHLRKKLRPSGFDGLLTKRNRIELDKSSFTSDVSEILSQLNENLEVPESLVGKFRGNDALLRGLSSGNDRFRDWLVMQRTNLQSKLHMALSKCLESSSSKRQVKNASSVLLELDRGDENACRALIAQYSKEGEIAEAVKCYAELWRYLEDEFDVEPALQTQQLIAEVKLSAPEIPTLDSVQPSSSETTSMADIKSSIALRTRPNVAISALDLEGMDTDIQAVSRAFRAELMARLSKFREWRVRDGSNARVVASDSDYEVNIVAIKVDQKTQLSITLTSCIDGDLLWSEVFNDISGSWSLIMAETANKVANVANVSISHQRLADFAGQEISTANGFDAWLIGQRLLYRGFRGDNWDKAEKLLQNVLSEEPEFTRAYTSLAQLCNARHLAFPGEFKDPQRFLEGLRMANMAINIDPTDCQAHLCRAWSLIQIGDFTDGEAAYATARELNPYDPWTTLSSALGVAFCGDIQTAQMLADRTLKMGWSTTPAHWGFHATIRSLCGDNQSCLIACDQAGDVLYNILAWKAVSHHRLGNADAAADEVGKLIEKCEADWSGPEPYTPSRAIEWVVSGFPIKDAATREGFESDVQYIFTHLKNVSQKHWDVQ